MTRVYCHSGSIKDNELIVTDPEQLHHLAVLRLAPGEAVGAFDETGNEYECAVRAIDTARLVLAVLRKLPAAARLPSITVAVAIPKHSKIDDIIDKLTQVGADRIIPLVSERVIVRLDHRDCGPRHRRWEKIALSATLQSRRNTIPRVDMPMLFPALLEESRGFDLKLIPTLDGRRQELKSVIQGAAPAHILALIGPEGDFTPEETASACSAGFIPISFGPNVLRVETAAVYICSVLAFQFRK